MAVFEYSALNTAGRKVKGIVDADSVRAARQKLKNQGIFPTTLAETSTRETLRSKSLNQIFQSGGVSIAQLSIATRQLATLVGAGIPLVESLRALGEQLDNQRLKTVFAEVCDRVNEGTTLADAMRLYPKVFPRLYPNMIASGEASGTLELVLERLADLLEAQTTLRRKVVAALAYPILMLLLCFCVVILLLVFVVPQLTAIFEEHKARLPLPTEIVIALSNFVQHFWWALVLVIAISIVLFQRYAKSENGRRTLDSMILRLFVVGSMVSRVAAARFARTLGTMLASGVELLTALAIVKNIIGNVVLQQSIEAAMEGVREGKSLANELDRAKLFPRLLVHMVAVGEQTGQLEPMLLRAAQAYESEVDTVVAGLTSILNPILILFLAGLVGMILLSVLLPMLEMTSLLG